MHTPGPRFSLALVVIASAGLVWWRCRRAGKVFEIEMDPSERDRGWVAGVRAIALLVGLAGLGMAAFAPRLEAYLGAWVGALVPALALSLGTRLADRRHAAYLRGPSFAHHLINGVSTALTGVGFASVLPAMPGIVPLHWAGVGDSSGYASPTKLWWTLVIIGFNTAVMLLAMRTLREGGDPKPRAALLRFTEALLTGFNLAALVLWLGVAFNALPGLEVLDAALLIAIGCAGLGALVAMTHAPAMFSRPESEPEPQT